MIPLQINTPEAKSPLDVVSYELGMLNQCCSVVINSSDYFDKVISLESFLIHARNLIDFLNGCCYPTDIKCTDFKNDKGKPIRVVGVSIEEDLKLRINRHCQHMSTDRLEKQIGWPINSITKVINESMRQFVIQLPSTSQTIDMLKLIDGTPARETGIFYKKSHSR